MDLRRRLRSGRPALNLVHTGGEEELARLEIVHTPTDLGRVLGLLLGTPPLPADDVDLFGGRYAHRIRVCAAEDCGLLFVDASRPGRRRWCSMERCGNLAKVRGHRARRAD